MKFTPKTNYFIIGICSAIVILISLFIFNRRDNKPKDINFECVKLVDCNPAENANMPIEPSRKLHDKNDDHLMHAQKNGLNRPIETNDYFDAHIQELQDKNILIEVVENKYFKLKSLTHSHPYLIPQAVNLLNEIGCRFQEQLKEKKQKNFAVRVTSILRTQEDQNKLSHRNSNASDHSAHMYGTTIDISYKNFVNIDNDSIESSYEGVQALTKVITDMREECKLLVVRERKQACFHITVVCCKPELTLKD